MTDAGDVHLADLNEERRRHVLVLSTAPFQRMAGRVLVAPQVFGDPDEVAFPWRIQVDDAVYGVDLLRSLSTDRLLERVERVPASAMESARRALRMIT